MPTILPISDLRNYTKVLEQVDPQHPVYLTRNGRGKYMITQLDDYDPAAALAELIAEIKKGEESLKNGKSYTIEEIAKEFDVTL